MKVNQRKAKAAVWTGKRTMEVREYPIPTAKKDGMVLKVDAAAVCGTDGHLFPQEPPYPAIMGHEVTGTIVDLGEDANKHINVFGGPLAVGDRVALYPWITCGKCPACVEYGQGVCTVCDNSFVYGVPYEKLGLEVAAGFGSTSGFDEGAGFDVVRIHHRQHILAHGAVAVGLKCVRFVALAVAAYVYGYDSSVVF